MKITRFQFFLLPVAATAGSEPKPNVLLKHLGENNDSGLLQARFEFLPRHEDAVMGVQGVEFCRAHSRYEAAIFKGGAFKWAEVEDGVMAALKGVR